MAALYGGQAYESEVFNPQDRYNFLQRGQQIWHDSLAHFYSAAGFPGNDLAKLQYHVTSWFKTRAAMAKHDFEGTELHEIAVATRQQSIDIAELWRQYSEVGRAITNVPPQAQNGCHFDLLYPFYSKFLLVPEAGRPSGHSSMHSSPAAQQSAQTALVHQPSMSGAYPWQRASGGHQTTRPQSPVASGRPLKRSYQSSSSQAPAAGPFVGLPISPSIVGISLAVGLRVTPCPFCSLSDHYSCECPSR